MTEVSKSKFFELLKADPRDIMPNHDRPYCTEWLVQRGRFAWGWSSPGWRNPGTTEIYAVAKSVKP
jgi:hypothetical protein